MKTSLSLFISLFLGQLTFAQTFLQDTAKAYAMPLLCQTPKGDILLSWTEKSADGKTAFCMATSKDMGQSFADKKTIATGYGIGNSRLMRAKVLPKKDGSLVAVFMYNPNATPPPAGGGQGGRGGGGGRGGSQVSYCVSSDGGNTWTNPTGVDTDPTPNLMRGFFDAAVLANGEVAVAYLKDVKGSTKHEERDLRMAITKNGVFQDEKLIDAVVCDCCNISLLVDAKGTLNVYYRDNNDDIRDIAKMTSTDNGQTFSKADILYADQWLIKGCPHNGCSSANMGGTNLVTWFAGGDNEKGLRLVSQDGKRLSYIRDASAKNASVVADANQAVFWWEQTNPATQKPQVAYQVVGKGVSDTQWLNQANALNATGLVANKEFLVVYEVKQDGKKNSIGVSRVKI